MLTYKNTHIFMDIEGFKIYVDRLHDGCVESLQESYDPDFLEQDTEDLAYADKVAVKGEAYLAENELILHLDIQTTAKVPCKICNTPVDVPVSLNGVYLVESLNKMKSGIFIFKSLLREAILLEAPTFSECSNSQCPARKSMSAFIVEPNEDDSKRDSHDNDGYQPFANLDL